jgi:hypothetical protein
MRTSRRFGSMHFAACLTAGILPVIIERARMKGLPVPTDFKGAAHARFGKPANADKQGGLE